MNPLATEINNAIQEQAAPVYQMLSKLGQELYMPKGIITQGAQAKEKAYKFDATIGIATNSKGPMYLECIQKNLKAYNIKDIFPYAPTTGKPELRKLWKEKIYKDNPSLAGKITSLPVVTNALTHGLSIVGDLFVNDGDYIVTPDKFWGNYRLTFSVRRAGILSTFQTFNDDNKFNVEGLIQKVAECGKLKPKVIVLLNFPNNPTGYTPTASEAAAIVAGLKGVADSGVHLVCVLDDAYFGMFYEDSITESLFGMLAGISPNILAVKLDGPTKEMFVWGLRVGFITFAATAANDQSKMMAALEQKVSGDIRGCISNCPHPSQTMVLEAMKDPDFESQRSAIVEILRKRANTCKKILANPKYTDEFIPYPFNSGYFLSLRMLKVDAEKLRMHLLDNYGVGTISTSNIDLRVAFSSMEEADLQELFDIIYKGCKELV